MLHLTADKREIENFPKLPFGNFFYPQTVRRHFAWWLLKLKRKSK